VHNELNIVLVEPEIPQNTGNIARTCAAIGAGLHLIRPLGFEITDKHVKRAGLDYWQYLDLHLYDSLKDFFDKNEGNFYFFSTKGKKTYSDESFFGKVYLFFGKETKGLTESLLKENLSHTLRLPMLTGIRSLNLSNSAAIAAFEVLRQWDFKGFCLKGSFPDET